MLHGNINALRALQYQWKRTNPHNNNKDVIGQLDALQASLPTKQTYVEMNAFNDVLGSVQGLNEN